MRKIAAYGAAAVLTLSAMGVGASYAQDTATTEDTTEAAAAVVASARTWLGVSVSETEDGLTITRVAPGSPAESAALQVDDVIVALNDTALTSAADLRAAIETAAAGEVVTLTVERADEEISVEVTLEAQTAGGRRGMFADPLHSAERSLGVTLEAVDGVYTVVTVDEDSPFALEIGDVITAVNGASLDTLDWRTLFDPASENAVILTVQRDDEEVAVEGTLTFFGGRQDGMHSGGGQPNGDRNGGMGGQRGGNPPSNDGAAQPDGAPPADLPADAPAADGSV